MVARDDQGLRQARVVVGDDVLAPRPVAAAFRLESRQEPLGEPLLQDLDPALSLKRAQVFVDTEEREGPSSGALELQDGRQRSMKQLAAEALASRFARATHHGAERPEGATVAVLAAALFESIPGNTP